MMACLHLDTSHSQIQAMNITDETKTPAYLSRLLAAGNDGYKSHLPFFSSENVSPRSFAMPLLLFIALLVALSSKSSFSRLVTEAGLPSFINNFYPTISIVPLEQRRYLYPACLTIQALLEVLDTEIDSLSIPRLKCILDGTFHQSTPSHFTVSQHDWPESMGPLELQYRVNNEQCVAAGLPPSFDLLSSGGRTEKRGQGGYSATGAEVENLSRFWRAEQDHRDSSPKVISG
ncbi:hypothetical protein F5878DRAFT_632106 [Lentinula raphanica]|uniref:Uncharacterized protein n=1 Tax=Lentinula raphanica TaxID=153919 RepID=A0AA38U7V6_9AGAR|nr:hypothetical protein F5878DRAFT_632106 [Lentinula raphanica]